MDKVKLDIIGLGRLGRKHAENIHYHIQNAELTAICSLVCEFRCQKRVRSWRGVCV